MTTTTDEKREKMKQGVMAVVALLAFYAALRVWLDFDGIKGVVVPDTVFSSRWPNAGGRVVVVSYSWWGLKQSAMLAEPRRYREPDDDEARPGIRWMVIDEVGGERKEPSINNIYNSYCRRGRIA
jgi:hypothetical protein